MSFVNAIEFILCSICLFELWNIMNTTREEKQHLSTVTSIIQLSKAEVVEPGALSTEIIQQVRHFGPANVSVKMNAIAFLFDGRRLRAEQAPDEMEEGDEIDAMLHQTGGGTF
ncbi:putative Ubiquitin-like domain superfamily [Helianthus anomalus]